MAVFTPSSVFRRYEVDGVPDSGNHDPKKSEIVQLLDQMQASASLPAVVRQTKALLDGVTPESELYGGQVLNDPDPAKNGYYYRDTGAWVKGRGFPDTVAELVDLAGTANTVTAAVEAGVNPSDIKVWFIEPLLTNTDDVVLNALPVRNVNGDELAPGEWPAGRLILLVNRTTEWRLLSDPDADAAAAVAAASAVIADTKAGEAADSAAEAAGYAAGVNLPAIVGGDAGKTLVVKGDETGFEFGAGGNATQLLELTKTADYTIVASDAGKMLAFNKATAVTATLPAIAGSAGELYRLINIGVGDLTIDPNASELVDGAATLTLKTGAAADIWPNASKTAWRAFTYSPAGDYLAKANNLSDLASPLVARTNLGLAWETIYDEQRSAISNLDLINLGAYRRLRGKIFVRPTAATNVSMRFSDTNGSTWYAGASDYHNSYLYGIVGTSNYQEDTAVAQMRISMTGSLAFAAANDGFTTDFEIDHFNVAGIYPWLTYKTLSFTSSGNISYGNGGGRLKVAAGALDAIRLFPASGTITSCDIFLEGLR